MSHSQHDQKFDEEDFRRLFEFMSTGYESLAQEREELEGEVLRHFESVTRLTDRFAERFFGEAEAEHMRIIADIVASRHPDRFLARESRAWAGALKSTITLCNLVTIGPPEEIVRVMRAASINDEDVQEAYDELHKCLPLPALEPGDRLFDLLGNLVGHDEEAHAGALDALGKHAATEKVGDSIFEFDLRAVPEWIPAERRRLYAEVVVLLDQILGNDLEADINEILHFYAGAFIKYGSEPALANSASDIAAAIAIFFMGTATEVPADRDEKMIAQGDAHLLEIINSAGTALPIAFENDPLPEVLRKGLDDWEFRNERDGEEGFRP